MRFSFAIILAVAVSPISATPIDANTAKCPFFCDSELDCQNCHCMTGIFFLHSESRFYFHIISSVVGTDKRVASNL
ncbi:hypothetical protein BDR03DRAFT_952334 [Suillus americanus]|nr:hypothetical protein BDR03DRAFT_952334 [Suillus americanus]